MKVSIICTNYNKGDWVREAMDSFLNQKTNFDFEIIIIDDASTDHSYEIIQEYQNKFPEKVRTFRNEVNLGIARTWKKVCQEAKGQYIARCDSDDFWTDPLKLQKQVDLLDASSDSLWSNTEFDSIMEKVNNETDVNARWQLMIDAEKIMMDDLCYIPVFEKGTATLQNKDVKGLVIRPVGVPYTFQYVSK